MAKFCFTGNPFVDAGLAGMCAAAKVDGLSELDDPAVDRAVAELTRVMTSDAMFQKRRVTNTKESAFATSEMSVIFPNGPFSNPAVKGEDNKKKQYRARVDRKHEAFRQLAAGQAAANGYGSCFVDGSAAFARVGNDEFPLVDSKSKRNFHPGLQEGHAVGALTALALEFFPLSVLRTGVNAGFFWFVHTAVEKIAIACAGLTLGNMNDVIARHEGLGFYGNWQTSRDPDAALVALISYLMSGSGQSAISWKEIEAGRYPVTAYVFSNDNRGPTIAAHDLPHQLFWFFAQLQYQSDPNQFNREVLRNERVGWLVAKRMLAREPMVTICCLRPDGGKAGRLLGGWQAHSLYATEVLELSSAFIHDVEAVSERIVGSNKMKDWMLLLQQRERVNAALGRLSRENLMTFDEFTRLVPPDDRRAALTARDYLLAAIYERQHAAERGEAFTPWDGEEHPAPAERHPLVLLAEQAGAKLSADADLGQKVAFDLAKAQRLPELRRAVLRAARRGVLGWNDFVNIFPPDQSWVSFLMRDYLLAYLYSALRDADLPEVEPVADKTADPIAT